MSNRDITSLRSTIDFLEQEKELVTIGSEVDPIYEVSGIIKACENGPALLFDKIKGYPGVRNVGNLLARMETAAKIFDVPDPKKLKFKCHQGVKNPIPPKVVDEAPCQEVVITKDIDVMATLPMLKHSERDGARILGGGNILVSGKYFDGGNEVVFKRMHFRGKDWSSMFIPPGTHLGRVLERHRGERVPVTVNIGTPPAVMLMAGGGGVYTVVPYGADTLAIAGGLQGAAVDICKAKTVDAYAVANSEWVIEGYIDTSQRVWETEEAEKLGKVREAPFFPEWTGYMGRAYRVPKFQATAITHRKDKPIFYSPLAQSFEGSILGTIAKEAFLYEFAERLVPGLVVDVNVFPGVAAWAHAVFQVNKKSRGDEGTQRNLISSVLGTIAGFRLVIAVDEDVDIYCAEDILWAIITRVHPERDIILGGGGLEAGMLPVERFGAGGEAATGGVLTKGGIGLDATVPLAQKWHFERPHYPVDRVDLRKWLSEDEIAAIRSSQSSFARSLAETGR